MNRIRDARQQAGLTQAELGKLVDLSQQQIAKLEIGKQRLTADMATRMARVLNVGLNDIVPGEERFLVEFLGRVGAGGVVVVYPVHSRGPAPLEAPPMTPDGALALEVVGNGLFPVYKAGDLLILDPPEHLDMLTGEEVVATLASGQYMLRRLHPIAEGRYLLLGITGQEMVEEEVVEARRVRHVIKARHIGRAHTPAMAA